MQMGIRVLRPYMCEADRKPTLMGDFTIQPFELTDLQGNPTHTNGDSSPCVVYGYFITHKECGKLVYITDTFVIKYKFSNLNHIILGVDYDIEEIGEDGAKKNHILNGHMNLDTARGFIEENKSIALKNVILCHLSTTNSSPTKFKEQISSIADCPVHIACKGLKIQL